MACLGMIYAILINLLWGAARQGLDKQSGAGFEPARKGKGKRLTGMAYKEKGKIDAGHLRLLEWLGAI